MPVCLPWRNLLRETFLVDFDLVDFDLMFGFAGPLNAGESL